jgi:8-oxo-dGTP diphosphatase
MEQAVKPDEQAAADRATLWPRAAASAAIFRGGEVLIGRRGKSPRQDVWSLPGGHIEPGEAARVAALREVREETGVEARIIGLVDINDVIIRSDDEHLVAHYLLAIYFGTWIAGEPVAADDCVEARFVPVGDVGRFNTTARLGHFIERAHANWREACGREEDGR